MIRYILSISLLLAGFNLDAQFGKLLDKAKESANVLKGGNDSSDGLDISGGLKEALELGVTEAVDNLSAQNGYLESPYKILIPEEAQKVINKVKLVPGFQNVEKELVSKMNAAAETAAKKATPIFIEAIKSMSFSDAKNILFGENNAGTQYLEGSSRKALYSAFLPVIQSSLDEVDATKYWKSVVSKYNSLPLTRDVNPDLDDHVNNKALDGMFSLIEVKEDKIREDVGQRSSPLLQDVFGQLDKK